MSSNYRKVITERAGISHGITPGDKRLRNREFLSHFVPTGGDESGRYLPNWPFARLPQSQTPTTFSASRSSLSPRHSSTKCVSLLPPPSRLSLPFRPRAFRTSLRVRRTAPLRPFQALSAAPCTFHIIVLQAEKVTELVIPTTAPTLHACAPTSPSRMWLTPASPPIARQRRSRRPSHSVTLSVLA